MDIGILEIFIALVALLIALYTYISWSYEHWSSRGVPGPKPTVPFGNFADVFLRRKPMCATLREIYDFRSDVPYVGYYAGNHPVLMIKDPDLIKSVLIKDFNVFNGRGLEINEQVDPLAAHLFNIDGVRWKVLRHKLTPVFTTGKLRHMFVLMSECADNFEMYLQERVRKCDVLEVRDVAARYSTDVIGSCAFGIDTHALKDENSVFRIQGRKIFESSVVGQIKRLMREISPRLFAFLRLSIFSPDTTKFFVNLMNETVKIRENEKVLRNDFVDMLLQIPKDNAADGFEWTDNLLAAQAFVFFAAGFETSSTTVSFALWELSRAPDIQEKLRDEILTYDEKNDGKILYDSVNEMKYLDMVVKETLRKNPPVVALVRKAITAYQIPGTKIQLPAGQRVLIPAYSLHRDPNYYPKPEVFDPERFSDEAKHSRHPMVFLPFGDGPKNCIGARFGYYQVKLALIKILKNYRVKPTTPIDEPYVIDKYTFILSPVGGITLKFEPINV